MVKKILFIQNRTGIKRSNFFDHWENIHAPHMVNVLKPQKYVLTFLKKILKMDAVEWQSFGSIQNQNTRKPWNEEKQNMVPQIIGMM